MYFRSVAQQRWYTVWIGFICLNLSGIPGAFVQISSAQEADPRDALEVELAQQTTDLQNLAREIRTELLPLTDPIVHPPVAGARNPVPGNPNTREWAIGRLVEVEQKFRIFKTKFETWVGTHPFIPSDVPAEQREKVVFLLAQDFNTIRDSYFRNVSAIVNLRFALNPDLSIASFDTLWPRLPGWVCNHIPVFEVEQIPMTGGLYTQYSLEGCETPGATPVKLKLSDNFIGGARMGMRAHRPGPPSLFHLSQYLILSQLLSNLGAVRDLLVGAGETPSRHLPASLSTIGTRSAGLEGMANLYRDQISARRDPELRINLVAALGEMAPELSGFWKDSSYIDGFARILATAASVNEDGTTALHFDERLFKGYTAPKTQPDGSTIAKLALVLAASEPEMGTRTSTTPGAAPQEIRLVASHFGDSLTILHGSLVGLTDNQIAERMRLPLARAFGLRHYKKITDIAQQWKTELSWYQADALLELIEQRVQSFAREIPEAKLLRWLREARAKRIDYLTAEYRGVVTELLEMLSRVQVGRFENEPISTNILFQMILLTKLQHMPRAEAAIENALQIMERGSYLEARRAYAQRVAELTSPTILVEDVNHEKLPDPARVLDFINEPSRALEVEILNRNLPASSALGVASAKYDLETWRTDVRNLLTMGRRFGFHSTFPTEQNANPKVSEVLRRRNKQLGLIARVRNGGAGPDDQANTEDFAIYHSILQNRALDMPLLESPLDDQEAVNSGDTLKLKEHLERILRHPVNPQADFASALDLTKRALKSMERRTLTAIDRAAKWEWNPSNPESSWREVEALITSRETTERLLKSMPEQRPLWEETVRQLGEHSFARQLIEHYGGEVLHQAFNVIIGVQLGKFASNALSRGLIRLAAARISNRAVAAGVGFRYTMALARALKADEASKLTNLLGYSRSLHTLGRWAYNRVEPYVAGFFAGTMFLVGAETAIQGHEALVHLDKVAKEQRFFYLTAPVKSFFSANDYYQMQRHSAEKASEFWQRLAFDSALWYVPQLSQWGLKAYPAIARLFSRPAPLTIAAGIPVDVGGRITTLARFFGEAKLLLPPRVINEVEPQVLELIKGLTDHTRIADATARAAASASNDRIASEVVRLIKSVADEISPFNSLVNNPYFPKTGPFPGWLQMAQVISSVYPPEISGPFLEDTRRVLAQYRPLAELSGAERDAAVRTNAWVVTMLEAQIERLELSNPLVLKPAGGIVPLMEMLSEASATMSSEESAALFADVAETLRQKQSMIHVRDEMLRLAIQVDNSAATREAYARVARAYLEQPGTRAQVVAAGQDPDLLITEFELFASPDRGGSR